MLSEKLNKFRVFLASASPRRKYLLEGLGLNFETVHLNNEEIYPPALEKDEIAVYLAETKAKSFPEEKLGSNTLVITADTIVWHKNQNLGKPDTPEEAADMLRFLSDGQHEVITGVCIYSLEKLVSFTASTRVWFKHLTEQEIDYYIQTFKPFDKAGSYGIQEWIGYIGVTHIDGSYFNVMGLPVQHLYDELLKF